MKHFLFSYLLIILISFSSNAQNLLLSYKFYPFQVSSDTVFDQSGNGNNALMVGGAYNVGGAIRIGKLATDYLDVPPVINGLNDFSMIMRINIQHLHKQGLDPMNTIFSASDSACIYCFGLAYNKSNVAWELTFNGVLHSFPQSLSNIPKDNVKIVRNAGLVTLAYHGLPLGSFYDATPLAASTFIFGQHEQCLGGCFDANQALDGGITRLRIMDVAEYFKSADDEDEESSLAAFPNPFSSTTTISFSLQQTSHTNITLLDVAGRKIKTLLDENSDEGNHEVVLNRESLTVGIYFVQLKTDEGMVTKKIVME